MEPSSSQSTSRNLDAFFPRGSIFLSGSSSSVLQTENSGKSSLSSNEPCSGDLDAFFPRGSIFLSGSSSSVLQTENSGKSSPSSNEPCSGDIDAFFPRGSIFLSGSSSSVLQTENSGKSSLSSNEPCSGDLDAFFPRGSIFLSGSSSSVLQTENSGKSPLSSNEQCSGDLDAFFPRGSIFLNTCSSTSTVLQTENSEKSSLSSNEPSSRDLDDFFPRGSIFLSGSSSSVLQTENSGKSSLSSNEPSSRDLDDFFPRGSIFLSGSSSSILQREHSGESSRSSISSEILKNSKFENQDLKNKRNCLQCEINNNLNDIGEAGCPQKSEISLLHRPPIKDYFREGSIFRIETNNKNCDKITRKPCKILPDVIRNFFKIVPSSSALNLRRCSRYKDHKIKAENEHMLRHLPRQLSLSDDDITSKTDNYHSGNLLGYDLTHSLSSSCGDISFASYQSSTSKQFSSSLSGDREKQLSYRLQRSLKLHGCGYRTLTSITSVPNKRLFWVALKNTTGSILRLCDLSGNEQKSLDVGAIIDDLAISDNGDLFMSCPKAQRIKVIRWRNIHKISIFKEFRKTEWCPRGLTIHPDGSVVACLTMSHWKKKTEVATKSCLKKFETGSEIESFVTDEKCFGYPLRVSVNTKNEIAVFDFGFQSIILLNSCGLVLARFSEFNEINIYSPLAALGCNKNNEFIIAHGVKPVVIAIKINDFPLSVREVSVGVGDKSELCSPAVSAMTFNLQDNMIIGSGYGTINVFEETSDDQQR